MPTKRNQQKSKKRGRRQVVTGAPGQQGAFPPFKMCTMNYADIISFTESAGGLGAFQVFRTADVYDPDYSGLGHQPMYFDQLCTSVGPYLLHTTRSAKFQLRFVNTSSVPALIVCYFSMANSSPTSRTQAQEKPFAWKHLLPPTGTGGAAMSHVMSVNNPKFVGLPLATYEATYQGNYGTSSPSPNLVVCVYGFGGVASVTLSMNALFMTKFFQLGPETLS